jgi:hypothetical protein
MSMIALEMTSKEVDQLALAAEEAVSLIGSLGDMTDFVYGHILSGSCENVDPRVLASLRIMARVSSSLYKGECNTLEAFATRAVPVRAESEGFPNQW